MTQQLTSLTVTFNLSDIKEQKNEKFETAVTESVDEVFTAFGETVKQGVYSYLENKHGIRKQQIPRMIEDFTNAIESIFGESAKLVELKIIEKLQVKEKGFTYKSKSKEIFFTEYLAELQRHLELQGV